MRNPILHKFLKNLIGLVGLPNMGRKIFLTLGFADIDYIHGCIVQSEKSQSSWLIAGLAHGEMLGQHLQLADHFAQNSF